MGQWAGDDRSDRMQDALNSDDDIWAKVHLAEGSAEVMAKSEKGEEELRKLLADTEYKITEWRKQV